MKIGLSIVLLLVLIVNQVQGKPGRSSNTAQACLLDAGSKHVHERQIQKVFNEATKGCRAQPLQSFPIYLADGTQSPDLVQKQIKKAARNCTILHFSWNRDFSEDWKPVIESLNRLKDQNILVVGAAGAPPEPEISAPASRTVLGKVEQVILVGEANSKGNLVANSYYGPELLTALEPPKSLKGSSFSSVLLTAKLACNWKNKLPSEWRAHLYKTQKSSPNPYPSLDVLFPN